MGCQSQIRLCTALSTEMVETIVGIFFLIFLNRALVASLTGDEQLGPARRAPAPSRPFPPRPVRHRMMGGPLSAGGGASTGNPMRRESHVSLVALVGCND